MALDIPTGICHSMVFEVAPQHCVIGQDRSLAGALATHTIVEWMEIAAVQLVAPHLAEDYTSVGRVMEVEHNALVPLGSRVVIDAEFEREENGRLYFHLSAKDQIQLFAIGRHVRVVLPKAVIERQLRERSGEGAG